MGISAEIFCIEVELKYDSIRRSLGSEFYMRPFQRRRVKKDEEKKFLVKNVFNPERSDSPVQVDGASKDLDDPLDELRCAFESKGIGKETDVNRLGDRTTMTVVTTTAEDWDLERFSDEIPQLAGRCVVWQVTQRPKRLTDEEQQRMMKDGKVQSNTGVKRTSFADYADLLEKQSSTL